MKERLKILNVRGEGAKMLLLFCFLFVVYLAFFNLGKAPLENWDEAWYAEVTKQILRTKEFIVLSWNHAVWLDKPPMYMWISALVSSFIGLSEFSMRFISALSGVIIVMLVVWYSQKKFGLVPALLAFLSLALNNVFVWRMRSGNIDVFVTLLILLTYFVLISKHKYKYKYPLLGLLFAFIYLTKASLVMFPLSIFLLHELIFERNKILKQYREYFKLFFIFFLLPGIWLLLGYMKVGATFSDYYLFNSDQGVATTSFMKFNTAYIMHAYYSLQRRFFYVFIFGTLFAIRYIKDSKIFLLLLYSIALLLQLSFTEKDNNWYLIPSIPFWSMLIAYGVYHIIKIFKKNKILVGIILVLSIYISYRTLMINILPILDSSSTVKQTESSKALNKLTKSDDIIVRLDHLYPTTIYYTDRKVLASPEGNVETKNKWISRSDLIKVMQQKKIRWFVGTNKEVETFKRQVNDLKIRLIRINDEEVIGEIL